MKRRGTGFVPAFAKAMTFFAIANALSMPLRSSSILGMFGCADCIVAWGFPLEVMRRGGYIGASSFQPAALLIDVVFAILASLAFAWWRARRAQAPRRMAAP